jgi:hypothetical protein
LLSSGNRHPADDFGVRRWRSSPVFELRGREGAQGGAGYVKS